jgi:hypothetical protein
MMVIDMKRKRNVKSGQPHATRRKKVEPKQRVSKRPTPTQIPPESGIDGDDSSAFRGRRLL